MAEISKKEQHGEVTHNPMQVGKQKQPVPVLKEMGLMEKSDFEKACEEGISIEEGRKQSLEFIRNLPWKK